MRGILGVLLVVFGVSADIREPSAADEPKKTERDVRQTVERYLAAVIAGKVEGAAALALPGSVEGSRERLAEYKAIIAAKTVRPASAHFSPKEGRAIVVTEVVPLAKPLRDGSDKAPIIIKLTRKDGEWYIRDVDFRADEVARAQLQDFLQRYPDAKTVESKEKK